MTVQQWISHEMWMLFAFSAGIYLGWAWNWKPPQGK